MSGRRSQRGFTLIEMLAVVFLTAVVLTVAIDFYLDLSRASNAAVEKTRHVRRAAVLLDRVARDLESAVLIKKPADTDPLAHPWLFLAEADDPTAGAERVKFVSRGRQPRDSQRPESDLEMVAWMLVAGDDGDLALRRWSAPQLPDRLDRSFPPLEESERVADGLASFGIRLLGDDGQWVGRWDSSQLAGSSELPTAAEISVAFLPEIEGQEEEPAFVRRVLLPMRPLDLEKMLAANGEAAGQPTEGDQDGDGVPDEEDPDFEPDEQAEEGEEGCVTVGECIARHPELLQAVQAFGVEPETIQSVSGQCARNFAAQLGSFAPDCLQ